MTSAQVTHRPRASRQQYQGAVRLMISVPPFRLLVSLRGLNLSNTGVCAQWRLPPLSSGKSDDQQTINLLQDGGSCALQLDPEAGPLPSPVLQARLVRRTATNAGLEMAFEFPAGDDSVLALLGELAGAAS